MYYMHERHHPSKQPPMATPLFVDAEYEDMPRTGLEVHDPGDTYKGLGGGYRWGDGASGRHYGGGACVRIHLPAPRLLDGDGDVVPTRWAQGTRGQTMCDPHTDKFLPFSDALAVAQAAGLASMREWLAWCRSGRRPPNVPSNPSQAYKGAGWQGWGHWLGTGNQHTKEFLPFGEALAVARSLELSSRMEWKVWCREGLRPLEVPSDPPRVYKDHGWQGWGHWLGTGNQGNPTVPFLPFAEALVVAQSLNLASSKEWRVWCKEGLRPLNVPFHPNTVYKDHGWQGWGHWLGTGNTQGAGTPNVFLPFRQALNTARALKLSGRDEWVARNKNGQRPANIPSNPDQTYRHAGWQGWGHWLGTSSEQPQRLVGRASQKWIPFDEALIFARSLRLAKQKEWFAWSKSGARPANMPGRPDKAYVHDGWIGYEHWLHHGNLGAATASAAQALPASTPSLPLPSEPLRHRHAAASVPASQDEGAAAGAAGPGRQRKRRRK